MANDRELRWLAEPEDQDYPAAALYLSLLWPKTQVAEFIEQLKLIPTTQYQAKDIFRACGLPLLGAGNSHVDANRKKIKKGVALSPILLVRDPVHGKVVIADGYHRLCAMYSFVEDLWIPCKIV